MTGRAFFAIVQTFFAITPALIYLVAGCMLTGASRRRPLTAGTLVAFTTLQARLQMPLLQLMRVSLDVQTSLALFRRHLRVPRPRAGDHRAPRRRGARPRPMRGEIEFRDVWFRYPEPRSSPAPSPTTGSVTAACGSGAASERAGGQRLGARGVSLRVEPGQLAAIVGPSGLGQDDHDLPRPAVLRRHRGRRLIDGTTCAT